jgi:hypothetical protein
MTDVERRKYIRHPFSYPLIVKTLHRIGKREELSYESKNIGGGGIQFHSVYCLPAGTVIEIDLWVEKRKFELSGMVVRCDVLEDRSFMVAVAFRNASEALKARLAEQAVRIELFKERLESRYQVELDLSCVAREWIERYAGAYARDHDF